MLSSEKIQIGVEVINNTGPALAKIKTDIALMAKGMQSSLAATNTLITQGMQKAGQTISASTRVATDNSAASFQKMQVNATDSLTKVKETSARTFTGIKDDATDSLTKVKETSSKSFNSVKEDAINSLTKVKETSSKSFIAIKDDAKLSIQGIKDAWSGLNATISKMPKGDPGMINVMQEERPPIDKATGAYKEYISALKNTIDLMKKKIELLNQLSTFNKKDEEQTKKQIVAAKEQIVDAKEQTVAAKEQTVAAKKQQSQLEMIAKRFLTIAAAIWLVRKAYQAAATSVKLYEEQSGMGASGGYARVSNSVGQIGIEIGSVLEKQFTALADYLSKNSKEIESNARQIANVVGSIVATLSNFILLVSGTVNTVIGSVLSGVGMLVSGVMTILNNTIMKLPGIPKGVKEAFTGIEEWLISSTDTWLEFTKQGFKDIKQSSTDLGSSFKDLWESFYTKPAASGIKFITAKEKEANEKRKSDIAAVLVWVAALQDKYNEATFNEYEYKRKKVNQEAQQDKIKAIQWEKALGIDLAQYKVQVEQWRAAAINKIDKDELDKKIARINEIEQKQKEADEAAKSAFKEAKSAAKSAGIGSGSIKKTPGSPSSNLAVQAFEGNQEINDKVNEMISAYDQMVQTGKYSAQELAQARIDIETNTVNSIKQLDYDLLQSRMQNIQSYYSMFSDVAKSITEIGSNMLQSQVNNLNKQTEDRKESLDKAYEFDTKYVKNKKKLDKNYDDAKKQIDKDAESKQKEFYKKQKGWSIANALIAGAEATMGAWSSAMKLGYPANVIVGGIMSGVITALTASQVALIASQKFAGGGIVKGPKTGDQVPIQANGGEMMLTTGQQTRLFNALNGQGTMGQQVTIAGDTYIVHGNLDKNAADQIQRQKEQRMSVLKSDIKELSYRGQLSFA